MGNRSRGVKPIANLRPLLVGNWTIEHDGTQKRYAVSAELVGPNITIFIDGNGYRMASTVLFHKSIKDCINEIIRQFHPKTGESENAEADPVGS